MTDVTSTFITIHNGDNRKLRIFSFLTQRQRMQLNFMIVAM